MARRAERRQRLRSHSIVVAVQPAALTAVYGTVQVQRAQLDALITASGAGELDLIVARRPLAILHGFELLDDVAVVETIAGAHVMADPGVVAQFRAALARLRRSGVTGRRAVREVEQARAALVRA